ncbi:MAG: transcriptional repressor NrdR [Acidimicrobiales bacterium]|nr:transcriptional repressor NrdR [Acidimicrobiales bacterium]
MRCPMCGLDDDKVVESRPAENGNAIRRRRECLGCHFRFTTFERSEGALRVLKRSGEREPFLREKVEGGLRAACKNRPITEADLERLVDELEQKVRAKGSLIQSSEIGVLILEGLAQLDQVAYMRFASVYKDFTGLADFQREVMMLEKTTQPKHRRRRKDDV